MGMAAASPAPQNLAQCVASLPDTPDLVQEAAQNWLRRGGGGEARDCLAQADLALGDYREAAQQYETLALQGGPRKSLSPQGRRAGQPEAGSEGEREAGYAARAAEAWLLAGDGAAAERAARQALLVSSSSPGKVRSDLTLLLARSLSMQGHYAAAIQALGVLPDNGKNTDPVLVRALVLRAGAYRQLGRNADGLVDVTRALTLQPDDIEALLERGILNVRLTRYAQARSDWDRVIALAPDGHEAYLARQDEAVLDSDPDQD